jgi:hypothetical protein
MKDEVTTLRLTQSQREFVDKEVERQQLKGLAEFFRKLLDDYMTEDHITVPLVKEEYEYLMKIAKELNVSMRDVFKFVLLSYKLLMESPLHKIIKPTDQLIEEIARRE